MASGVSRRANEDGADEEGAGAAEGEEEEEVGGRVGARLEEKAGGLGVGEGVSERKGAVGEGDVRSSRQRRIGRCSRIPRIKPWLAVEVKIYQLLDHECTSSRKHSRA